jgi:hypothetical protein
MITVRSLLAAHAHIKLSALAHECRFDIEMRARCYRPLSPLQASRLLAISRHASAASPGSSDCPNQVQTFWHLTRSRAFIVPFLALDSCPSSTSVLLVSPDLALRPRPSFYIYTCHIPILHTLSGPRIHIVATYTCPLLHCTSDVPLFDTWFH